VIRSKEPSCGAIAVYVKQVDSAVLFYPAMLNGDRLSDIEV